MVQATHIRPVLATGTKISNSTPSSKKSFQKNNFIFRNNDYQMRQTRETMPFNNTLSKVQHSYKVVPWTFSADGLLHSGDSVLIKSKKVNGHLAADLGVKQINIDESYRLNTSKANQGPVTRNVFVINRFEKEDIFGTDSVIRFG